MDKQDWYNWIKSFYALPIIVYVSVVICNIIWKSEEYSSTTRTLLIMVITLYVLLHPVMEMNRRWKLYCREKSQRGRIRN